MSSSRSTPRTFEGGLTPRETAPVHSRHRVERPAVFVSIETTAFSGATLLAYLLAGHPDIATVGEADGLLRDSDPDEYSCSCGIKIRACPFWRSVTESMRNRGFTFEVGHFGTKFDLGGTEFVKRLRRGSLRNHRIDSLRDAVLFALPGQRRKLKALAERNRALIESVLEVTGKSLFVDSSKDRMRAGVLRRLSSIEVRAIHLVRDVRGVVASQMRRGRGPDAARLARDWEKRHRRLNITFEHWPSEDHMRLRYEDLCRRTEESLSRVFEFLGVAPTLPSQAEQSERHLIGNPMRLRPLSEIAVDERWKTELGSHELAEIERVAGSLNRRFGYDD